MTTTTETVYCAGCGDEVASVDEKTECGPCCHNLPEKWSRTAEGFYTGTPGEEDHWDDEDEDEYDPPSCHDCGRHSFTIRTTHMVSTREYEEVRSTIFFDPHDYTDATVTCSHCGAVQHYDLEAE